MKRTHGIALLVTLSLFALTACGNRTPEPTVPATTEAVTEAPTTEAVTIAETEPVTEPETVVETEPPTTEEPTTEAKKEEPPKETKPADYVNIYKVVPNDGTWYVSNDGMTAKFYSDYLGKFTTKAYTLDGLKAGFATSGQIIDNGDGTIRIACCGCCAEVEQNLGIISYMGCQSLASSAGYNTLLRTEDYITWIDPRQDTYTHNFDWYYFTY